MVVALSRSLHELFDLVLPSPCPGCGCPGARAACAACRQALVVGLPSSRLLPVATGQVVTACAAYDGSVRQLLVARKERGARQLDGPLGAALASAVAAALVPDPPPSVALPTGGGPVLLVPVPSRPAVVRGRGEDTVAGLARAAARACGAQGRDVAVVRALRHVRQVSDSAGLDVGARYRNLDGALGVRPAAASRLRGRAVVVVDDLSTTGATLAEAVRALGRAGVGVRATAVVALVPDPGDDPHVTPSGAPRAPRRAGTPARGRRDR